MSARSRRDRALRAALEAAVVALLAAACALYAASVAARPGGGQSFGGRGGGGKGGSGGGECAIDIVLFLLELTIEHPAVGIPIDLVVVGVVVIAMLQKGHKETSWSTSSAAPTAAAEQAAVRGRPSRLIRRDLLATVSRIDPSFSIVLFEDFLYALYAAAQEARGNGRLETLAPYLRPAVREVLADRAGLTEVRSPVIGALRYLNVAGGSAVAPIHVKVELEANFTEVGPTGEHTFYVVDRWELVRAPTARSRPPEKAGVIGCPNCGAPLSELRGSTCSYCKQVVDTGAFDWVVSRIEPIDRMARPPQLTSDNPEAGNELPTVVDPDAGVRMQVLTRKDPLFQWPRFLGRVGLIFAELQPAWSTLEWTRARPFVSDQLFQMLAYWIEGYKRAHLRNLTENARITGIELAAVVSDRYYEAITVRVRATGLDYTVDDAGHVVSGSRSRERPYSEYWTLIRGTTAQTRGTDDRACPNCGAPLAINMAGNCTHCRAKVTSGDFDWVLSRIEQDEAYTG
jgi:predicted lipid-binding transport protein (Tim44 family)